MRDEGACGWSKEGALPLCGPLSSSRRAPLLRRRRSQSGARRPPHRSLYPTPISFRFFPPLRPGCFRSLYFLVPTIDRATPPPPFSSRARTGGGPLLRGEDGRNPIVVAPSCLSPALGEHEPQPSPRPLARVASAHLAACRPQLPANCARAPISRGARKEKRALAPLGFAPSPPPHARTHARARPSSPSPAPACVRADASPAPPPRSPPSLEPISRPCAARERVPSSFARSPPTWRAPRDADPVCAFISPHSPRNGPTCRPEGTG